MEEIKDQKYSRLGGMDERYKTLTIRRKGIEDWRYSRKDEKDERLGILTFRGKW